MPKQVHRSAAAATAAAAAAVAAAIPAPATVSAGSYSLSETPSVPIEASRGWRVKAPLFRKEQHHHSRIEMEPTTPHRLSKCDVSRSLRLDIAVRLDCAERNARTVAGRQERVHSAAMEGVVW